MRVRTSSANRSMTAGTKQSFLVAVELIGGVDLKAAACRRDGEDVVLLGALSGESSSGDVERVADVARRRHRTEGIAELV